MESLTSATLSSGILPPTALNRSIGPLRHLALEGLGKSVTDDVVIEACVLSSNAGSGLSDINLSGCSELKLLFCVLLLLLHPIVDENL